MLPQLVGTWFQVLLTPLKGVLFTVQSPYWFTIGRRGVLSLGGWAPLLHTEFHGIRATLERRHCGMDLRLQDCHLLWWTFPDPLTDRYRSFCQRPQPRSEDRFGLIRFRSPLLTESRLISFPPGTEMFQFPGLARHGLCVHPCVTPSGCPVTPGCPIRRSPDQGLFDGSPEHIAACHVLHRLSTPRHPPCTLSSLTIFMSRCRPSFLRHL